MQQTKKFCTDEFVRIRKLTILSNQIFCKYVPTNRPEDELKKIDEILFEISIGQTQS